MSDGDLLLKIIGFSLIVMQAVTFVRGFRRLPPVSEEMYRDFATKKELQQLRDEFLKTSGEAFDVLRSQQTSFSASLATIQTSLSATITKLTGQVNRMQGILSRCPGPLKCAEIQAGEGE